MTHPYLASHKDTIEIAVSKALQDTLRAQSSEPLKAIAASLLQAADGGGEAGITDIRKSLATGAAARQTAEAPQPNSPSWSIAEWLDTLKTSHAIAHGLMSAVGLSDDHDPDSQLALVKLIGGRSDGKQVLRSLLERSLDTITDNVWQGTVSLVQARACTSTELISKFVDEDDAFELKMGDMETFHQGLDGLIGLPSPNFLEAMYREHCMAQDSSLPFTTGNYQITTTSTVEYYLVVFPETGLETLNLVSWPMEQDLRAAGDSKNEARQPVSLDVLRKRAQPIDDQLKAVGASALVDAELIAGRMYTGPCFLKYNAVLRAFTKVAPMERAFQSLCLGNPYTTTLHAINSCLIKLSKVQTSAKVFRGVKGGTLPEQLLVPNVHGIRAGVEFAFLSTTLQREVAADYAGHGAAMIFELQMGMIDRGADLSWISQYPHEQEICFPPLSGLEVVGMRVEGTMLLVETRISLNLNAMTLEQHVAKMQRSHQQLLSVIIDDLRFMGAPASSVCQLESLAKEVAESDPAQFNRSDAYNRATTAAIERQKTVLVRLSQAESWEEEWEDDVDDVIEARAIAKRMFNCAEVCARAGHLETAVAMLRLSLQTCPLDAMKKGDGAAQGQQPRTLKRMTTSAKDLAEVSIDRGNANGRGRADTSKLSQVGAVSNEEAAVFRRLSTEVPPELHWAVDLFYLLLADGALQPWPPVLAHVAHVLGPDAANALGKLTAQLLKADPFVAGTDVIVYKDVGDCWTECAGVIVTEEDADGKIGVRMTDDSKIGLHPAGRVLFQESDNAGAGAVLRAAAQIGATEVIDALLVSGVSAMLADASRTNSLHLSAEAGHTEAVKRILASGLEPSFLTLSRAGGGGKMAVELARENNRAGALRALAPRKSDEDISFAAASLEPALVAARDDNLDRLKRCDLTAAVGGVTALHMAARHGHVDVVKYLLDNGCSVAAATTHGFTALHFAAEEGFDPVVQALLEADAAVDQPNALNWSPLLLAAIYDQCGVASLLIAHKADVNRQIEQHREWSTPLLAATDAGAEQMVRLLLDAKADIHQGQPILGESGSGLDGWFPLMDACQCGAHVLAKLLINQGANANQTLRGQSTPLYFAACNGHFECCQHLIEAKAWVNQYDTSNGRGPMYWAARYGHTAVVKLLITHGADCAKALTSTGRTPLQEASFGGYLSIVRQLLNQSAPIDDADKEGDAAIHLATRQGHKTVVQFLCQSGASLDALNKQGESPEMIAKTKGYDEIARVVAVFGSRRIST